MPPSSRLALLALVAACSDPDPAGGHLELRTPVVAFGTVPCGTTAVRTLTLGNSGDRPLSIALESSIATVEVAPASVEIDPGQELDLAVIAHAALVPGETAIPATGELAITGGATVPVTFQPAGVLLTIPDAPIDFGDVDHLSSEVRGFTMFATGTGTATVSVRSSGLVQVTTPGTLVIPSGGRGEVRLELAGQPFPATIDENLTIAVAGDVCSADRATVKLRGRLVP